MKRSRNPFQSHSSEELVALIRGVYCEWSEEEEAAAREELKRGGIPEEEEDLWLARWNGEDEAYEEYTRQEEKKEEERLHLNQFEDLTSYEKRFYFFFAPVFLVVQLLNFAFRFSLPGIPSLLAENYKRKYWERLLFVILGLTAWGILIVLLSLIPSPKQN